MVPVNATNAIRSAIVILWVAAMGALLRFEAYPQWFTRTIPGYKGLIADTLLTRESWSRILIGGVPAGYSHTILGINDETPENLLEINNRVHLRILLFGDTRRFFTQTLIALDRDFGLASFEATVSTGDLTVQAKGHRVQSRRFEITLTTGDMQTVRTIEIPSDTFLYSPVQELALRSLRPGSRLSLHTINPLTFQTSTVLIEAIAEETILISGEPLEAVRLRSTWQGMALDSWVNADGLVLRQETPLGWIIEACTAAEALAAVSGEHSPPPLFGGNGGHLMNLLTGKVGAP